MPGGKGSAGANCQRCKRTKMTKIFCKKCGNPLALDLNEFHQAGVSSVDCPHCGESLRLFSAEPKPPVVNAAQPPTKNTFLSVISILALVFFFCWSGLIAIWGIGTCFGWISGGLFSNTNSDARNTGQFFGVIFSLAILFGVWLLGAVPSFLVWFIFKIR